MGHGGDGAGRPAEASSHRTLKATFIAWGISERSKRGSGVLRFRAQKHHLSKSVENRGEPGWMEAGRPFKKLEQKYR